MTNTFKLRAGEEFLTTEFVEKVEARLAEAITEFGGDSKLRIPLARIAALGFRCSVANETGSEFVARRAEKALLHILNVPDTSMKLRFRCWFLRCWYWLAKNFINGNSKNE